MCSRTAAANCSVPYIMSTASSTTPEEIAETSGSGSRWFQPYWPPNEDNEITISMLARAKSAGFTTLVVTLDLWALSWRPKDLDNAYVPFYLGIGDAICLSDPVFQKKWKDGPGKGKSIQDDFQNACMGWEKTVFSGHSHTWEDIKFLKEHWDGPIVLKGLPCCFIY
jgi:lactate 2-monooxygenase